MKPFRAAVRPLLVNRDELPWWRRRGPQAAVVLVLLAALAGGVFALVRHHSDQNRLAAGQSREGDWSVSDFSFTGDYRFSLPGASVAVNVKVADEASKSGDSLDDDVEIKAPRNGLLVQLEWAATGGAGKYLGPHRSGLSVRSKDTSVVVDRAITPTSGASYDDDRREKVVALHGDLADLKLQAEFEGRTQTVSLLSGRRSMGSFASLYRAGNSAGYFAGNSAGRSVSIEENQPIDSTSPFRWSGHALGGQVSRTPYLDGLGWASPGHEWILVLGAGYEIDPIETATWRMGDERASYVRSGSPVQSVALDGRRPVKTLGKTTPGDSAIYVTNGHDYAYSVPLGAGFTIRTTVHVALKRSDGDAHAPTRTSMQLRETDTYDPVVDPTVAVHR